MDVREYVLSAGRAVLDMVEREWQPLSPGELEQRLDQAVEEILEADLMAKVKTQPAPAVYVQLLQSQANVQVQPQVLQTTTSSPTEKESPELREPLETVESAAVNVRSDKKSVAVNALKEGLQEGKIILLTAVHINITRSSKRVFSALVW